MQLQTPSSPIPIITVFPAPFQRPPSPPLTEGTSDESSENEDSYRPTLLTPPQSLPYRHQPTHKFTRDVALDRASFESLLKASRDRSLSKREFDLRREVGLKAHRSKQEERRARFLAKIGAPPSPTATNLPVTPPESPALFHFRLPSPGLVSPLALFESLGPDTDVQPSACWVEQVEFHWPKGRNDVVEYDGSQRPFNMRRHSLPSLEEISTHFQLNAPLGACRPRAPLPAFLGARKSPPSMELPHPSTQISRMELCHHSTCPTQCNLQMTTLVVPRFTSTSPTALTEANLIAFEQRAQASRGLNTLKRRLCPHTAFSALHDERRERRFSAPPQLPHLR